MIRQCNKQLYFISKKRKIKIYLKKEQTNLLLYAFEDVSRWDEKKSHVYMHISALRHLHPSVPWPFQAPPLLPQMISTLKKNCIYMAIVYLQEPRIFLVIFSYMR
jgi:hypothetical protein